MELIDALKTIESYLLPEMSIGFMGISGGETLLKLKYGEGNVFILTIEDCAEAIEKSKTSGGQFATFKDLFRVDLEISDH